MRVNIHCISVMEYGGYFVFCNLLRSKKERIFVCVSRKKIVPL